MDNTSEARECIDRVQQSARGDIHRVGHCSRIARPEVWRDLSTVGLWKEPVGGATVPPIGHALSQIEL